MQNIFSSYGVLRVFGKSVAAVLLMPVLSVAEPVTVLALGDSLTQGYGLVAQQGFVPQMHTDGFPLPKKSYLCLCRLRNDLS